MTGKLNLRLTLQSECYRGVANAPQIDVIAPYFNSFYTITLLYRKTMI